MPRAGPWRLTFVAYELSDQRETPPHMKVASHIFNVGVLATNMNLHRAKPEVPSIFDPASGRRWDFRICAKPEMTWTFILASDCSADSRAY